jgi:uncharacterized protein YodC (DUF2158 family)
MINKKFKVGDTVVLKSESPIMTVVKITEDPVESSEDVISCFFWNPIKGEFSTQDFASNMLGFSGNQNTINRL